MPTLRIKEKCLTKKNMHHFYSHINVKGEYYELVTELFKTSAILSTKIEDCRE